MEVCSQIPPPELLESTPKGEIGFGVTTGVVVLVLGLLRAMGLWPSRLSDDAVGVL